MVGIGAAMRRTAHTRTARGTAELAAPVTELGGPDQLLTSDQLIAHGLVMDLFEKRESFMVLGTSGGGKTQTRQPPSPAALLIPRP